MRELYIQTISLVQIKQTGGSVWDAVANREPTAGGGAESLSGSVINLRVHNIWHTNNLTELAL